MQRAIQRAIQRVVIAAALVATSMVVVACSGSGGDEAASTTSVTRPAQSGAVAISAVDNNFRPQDVTVTKGSTITWTNDGRADHNIVAFGPTPFHVATADFGPGASYSWVADQDGRFTYYCSIHGTQTAGMFGSVTVVPN